MKMEEKEFWEIFKDYNMQDLKIPGFSYDKNIKNIPKPILINSFFIQKKKDLKVTQKDLKIVQYIYDKYKENYDYRKIEKMDNEEDIIKEISIDNYNQILIYLLVNQNQRFQTKGAEYINSGKLDELLDYQTAKDQIAIVSEDNDVFGRLERENSNLNGINEKLGSQNAKLKSQNDKLISQNDKLKSQNVKLKNQNEKLLRNNKKVMLQILEAKIKIEQNENEINKLSQMISERQKELTDFQIKYDDLMKKYIELQNELSLKKTGNKIAKGDKKDSNNILVITNESFSKDSVNKHIEIKNQNAIKDIIESWNDYTSIYVSECYINEKNRRILNKQRKEIEKSIFYLNDNEIEKIIRGGN